MTSRLLTPANQITILRLVFIPLFAILEVERDYGWALAILAAAMISDFADGVLARLRQEESALGVALDPIADKFLMATAFLLLSFHGALPWWLTILVLSRDGIVLATTLLISLIAGYRPFRPSLLGKISTFFQMATILVAVYSQASVSTISHAMVRVSVYLTFGFTIASGVHYLLTLPNRIGQRPAEESPASAGNQTKAAPSTTSNRE